MPKFFINPSDVSGDTLIIREDAHHIAHVLRQGPGDEVLVCDGEGMDYVCSIQTIEVNEIHCQILSGRQAATEPAVKVTLFQGLPKAEKMEWIIQKTTELGIEQIVPINTRRSVVKLDSKKEKGKIERWNKIAEAAAKQSGRGKIPAIGAVRSIKEAIAALPEYDQAILLYEDENKTSLKEVLSHMNPPASVAIFIGPEGGWDPDEVERLTAAGVVSAGLGPRILRTETAGMAALVAILYHFDEMQ